MGNCVVILLVGFVLLFIQSHPLLPYAKSGLRPDLVLVLVTYLGAHPGIKPIGGSVVVSILGYGVAVFSGSPLGLYSFIYLVLFLFVRLLRTLFVLQQISVLTFLVTISGMLEGGLVFLAFWTFHYSSGFFSMFNRVFIGQLFFTVVFAPFIIAALQRFENVIEKNKNLNLFALLGISVPLRKAKQ